MKPLKLFMLILILLASINAPVSANESANYELSAGAVDSQGFVEVTASAAVEQMYGYEISLSFDSGKLEHVSSSSLIPNGYPVELPADGDELVFADTRTGNAAGLTGQTALAVFKFKVKPGTAGQAQVTWNELKVIEAEQLGVTSLQPRVSAQVPITTAGYGNGGAGGSTGANEQESPEVITLTPVVSGSAAKAELTLAALNQLLGQAVEVDGMKQAVIRLLPAEGAVQYRLSMPVDVFKSGAGNQQLVIETPEGSIALFDDMLSRMNIEQTKSVELVIGAADKSGFKSTLQQRIGDKPVIELYLMVDGERMEWRNQQSPVLVLIPYEPTAEERESAEHLAVWYVDGEGKVTPIPSGQYVAETGHVVFTTTHFSNYAVGFEPRSYSDLSRHGWAKHAIEVMASKGIINGISEQHYAPSHAIKRADFIQLLVRLLELELDEEWDAAVSFEDVPANAYYAEAAGIVGALGIAEGDGRYLRPQQPITRQELMTMLHRALLVKGTIDQNQPKAQAQLTAFLDEEQVSDYARDAMAVLVGAGLLEGDGERLHPLKATTRAEAAVLLYRVYGTL
jgi:hypothetical protein